MALQLTCTVQYSTVQYLTRVAGKGEEEEHDVLRTKLTLDWTGLDRTITASRVLGLNMVS
jgi:hypothetical protein